MDDSDLSQGTELHVKRPARVPLHQLGFFFSVLCLLFLNSSGALHGAGPLPDSRKIAREPAYQTKTPYYALLAFGPEGKDLVWVVHDGNHLYVDRNGNGDLTEPGERIEREPPRKGFEHAGHRTFEVGELKVGGVTHKAMSVFASPLKDNDQGKIAKFSAFKEALRRRPEGNLYVLRCGLAYPAIKGRGLDERLEVMAGPIDPQGMLILGENPLEAPVLRFGGPIHIDFGTEKPTFRPGIATEVGLSVGFPSTGPGTFVTIGYEGLIPPEVKPVVLIESAPATPGAAPYRESFELPHRCCTVNLYGPVKVDDKAASRDFTATLSLPGWKSGQVVGTRHSFTLSGAVSKVSAAPISRELFWSVPHPETGDLVGQLKYSPDGKQLMIAGYPSGMVKTIDMEGRKEVRRIQCWKGLRPSQEYARLTPDWRTLLVAEESRRFQHAENQGKKETLVQFAGKVQVWNFQTGEPMTSLQPLSGFGAGRSLLSPDGKKLLLEEQSSHQASDPEGLKKSQSVIWDWQTGERKEFGGNFYYAEFSRDSKSVFMNRMNGSNALSTIQKLDLETGKAVAEYSFADKERALSIQGTSPDGRLLAVRVTPSGTSTPLSFLFLDTQKLEEKGRMLLSRSSDVFWWQTGSFNPDGTFFQAPDGSGNISLWSATEMKTSRVLPMENESRFRQFSPDGQILAVLWTPKYDEPIGSGSAPDPSDLPQPRITLHYLNDPNKPPVTLIAPHGHTGSLAFRPDGKELAFGSSDAVHLFDLTELTAKP